MNHTDKPLARVSRGWPHAPLHRLSERGAYIVTAGTYLKKPYLNSPERLDMLLDALFLCAGEFGWSLQAWAILNNHYHHGIVARAADYPWCSAAWFEREATTAFVNTINGFKIDQVKVRDDF